MALQRYNTLTAMQKDVNEVVSRPLSYLALTCLVWAAFFIMSVTR